MRCRGLLLASMVLLGACVGARESLPSPGRYDEQGLHVVAHNPGECSVCDLYARAKGFVVRIVSASGAGAGVVLDANGRLVTNAHVVGGSRSVQVEAADGHTYLGRVLATDTDLDLAIVEAQSPGVTWPTPVLHQGTPPPVGSDAYVIGHPLGLGWTVTRGIISGYRRLGDQTLVQTDAAVSPGNSGGALLDAHGRLIGIVSAKVQLEGAENLGFARPTSSLLAFLGTLAAKTSTP